MIGTKILFKVIRIIPLSMLIVNYSHYVGTNDNILVLFRLSGFFYFIFFFFFILKAGHLAVVKCDVAGRSYSPECTNILIDFGQRRKRKSSPSFCEEEPCSSLTIVFFWPAP